MKVLISGASGYIGAQLVRSLLAGGHRPGAITRSGFLPTEKEGLLDVYKADITTDFEIDLRETYDLFVHLAAANDIDSADPVKAIMGTTLGTRNCLEFCKRKNIPNFIYFSTFQVTGRTDGKISEALPPQPRNDYGITHLFAEDYVKMYHLNHGLNYLILRPTNIYGAPIGRNIDRWTLVPNCFCLEAVEKKQITLLSSGRQMRDFVRLSELVELTIHYIRNFGKHRNETVNVSSGNNFTIIEIAELVREMYVKRFGEDCRLIVKSDLPQTTNDYVIDRSLVERTGYHFGDKTSLIDEINAIFNILTSN